jgi:hypothetical protein
VHTSTPAIPCSCVPETHRISKQLVAYLETLVAFGGLLGDLVAYLEMAYLETSPFYLAADPRTQGKIENFYRKALDRYKDFTYRDFTYEEFHKYIARKMEAFYKRYGFPKSKADKEEPEELEEPKVGDVVAVDAGAEPPPLLPTPTVRMRLQMPPLQMQRRRQRLRLRPKRPRLDLCAMHGIKTLPCINLPELECKMQQNGSRSETI